jgi:hypothetical protein
MSKKMCSTCSTYDFCYQCITRGIEKQACLVSIKTMRLNFDASCNENGSSLFLDSTPCFLVTIIVKCNKLVTTEAQTLVDYGALACFMDKELM